MSNVTYFFQTMFLKLEYCLQIDWANMFLDSKISLFSKQKTIQNQKSIWFWNQLGIEKLNSLFTLIWIGRSTDYWHTKAKSLIICCPNSNPNSPKNLRCGYKGLVLCKNNGWIIEKMDKRLAVPKWVLTVWPKIHQMPQHLSAQFVCPGPKIMDFNEKEPHWASVVRGIKRIKC